MKKYFIFIMSAMMLFSCSGNKNKGNTTETSSAETVEDVITDEHSEELLWGCVSIDNDQLDAIADVDREEFYQAQEFLMEVLNPGEDVDTFSEEWITAHCSPEVKQFLRDQYDFDGEGYAKWLMEGRFAGEGEYETEVLGFGFGERHGKPVYSIEKRYSFEGMESFVRNLYFGLQRNGEDFIITSFEMNLESQDPTVAAMSEVE